MAVPRPGYARRMPHAEVRALLVPLDGSDFSAAAVPVAADLARRFGGRVDLLSVVDPDGDREARERELAALTVPGVELTRTVVAAGDPAAAIGEALGTGDRVVCMATHGRARSAALVGSVAHDVITRSRAPLILTCPYVRPVGGGRGVLGCVDPSDTSGAVVPATLEWARRLGEPAVVATVAENVPAPVTGGPVRRAFGPDGDPQRFLDEVVAEAGVEGDVTTRVVEDPISVWSGLYHHLRQRPATLLVVSTRSRRGLARAALGSVAAQIVRHSPAPVLVVPRAAPGAPTG